VLALLSQGKHAVVLTLLCRPQKHVLGYWVRVGGRKEYRVEGREGEGGERERERERKRGQGQGGREE
jgi:hypothetical protein